MENSLQNTRPDLLKEWHPTKNGDLKPEDIGAKSHTKVWWQCIKNPSHVWEAPPTNRNRKSGGGCPYCSNRRLSPDGSNSLAKLFPEIAEIWHPTKNRNLTALTVIGGGSKKYWWKCPEGDDHVWEASIHQIHGNINKGYRGNGCPYCRGLEVARSNSLALNRPDVAVFWDHEKNFDTPLDSVTLKSNKKVFWKCPVSERHKWKVSINNQVNSIGCKYCNKIVQRSFQEMVLLFELKLFWKDIKNEVEQIERSTPKKYSKPWDIDIYIPELNIGIEYDGFYYHKSKEKRKTDEVKTKDLISKGITIIHVLERLKKINEKNDVVFTKFEGKNVVDLTLKKIVELKGTDMPNHLKKKIEEYLSQDKLLNEDAREEFRTEHIKLVMREHEDKKYLNKNKIDYWDFNTARDFARNLNLSSQTEWKKYIKVNKNSLFRKPIEVPSDPYSFYRDIGWKSWRDWLGTSIKKFRDFYEARKYIHSLNLRNTKEWRQYIYGEMDIEKPDDIPSCPDKVYKDKGYKNFRDWIGRE